jgi:hypothetical protein
LNNRLSAEDIGTGRNSLANKVVASESHVTGVTKVGGLELAERLKRALAAGEVRLTALYELTKERGEREVRGREVRI